MTKTIEAFKKTMAIMTIIPENNINSLKITRNIINGGSDIVRLSLKAIKLTGIVLYDNQFSFFNSMGKLPEHKHIRKPK